MLARPVGVRRPGLDSIFYGNTLGRHRRSHADSPFTLGGTSIREPASNKSRRFTFPSGAQKRAPPGDDPGGANVNATPVSGTGKAPAVSRDRLPPAILLDGRANQLSAARSLSAQGVEVYAINEPDSYIHQSRHCTGIALGGKDVEKVWAEYLLGPQAEHLHGGALLAFADAAIQFILHHRAALGERYVLDDSNPEAQLAVLDKLSTYRIAQAAGVPTPGFWAVEQRDSLLELRDQLVYPVIVKPHLSHVFEARFGSKFVTAHSFEELVDAYAAAEQAGIAVLIMELIPGPDDRLCSYYTYLDERGEPLFHFTKRIIRRYPVGMGGGSYHVTDWIPEARDVALKFLRASGLRGLGNVEMKRDDRDGQLKIIECNARFTAANELVTAAGFDLPVFVYNRLFGRPQAPLTRYRVGLRLWSPVRDFYAFRQLQRAGELDWWSWLSGVARPQVFPLFRWTDPMPALHREWSRVAEPLGRRMSRLGEWFGLRSAGRNGEGSSALD
jgi:D-aspartate ligase